MADELVDDAAVPDDDSGDDPVALGDDPADDFGDDPVAPDEDPADDFGDDGDVEIVIPVLAAKDVAAAGVGGSNENASTIADAAAALCAAKVVVVEAVVVSDATMLAEISGL